MVRRLARAGSLALLFQAAVRAAPAASQASWLASGKSGSMSTPMQIALLLTALTLLPAAVISVTPFLRISIVLHFLRQALGTQTAPSNQVLVGMALFLSLLTMGPVAGRIYDQAWTPMENGQITAPQAAQEAAKPLREFWLRFAREKDIALFLEVSHAPAPRTPADVELKVLIPAYILSELKASFQIGAVLYLPFLVIDLVVASVTLSVGMVQLPPVMISAPFKILLFVLVDGWNLVVGSLMKSLA
ncbi:MAG TPA: flagellar type III secretion system pore protein FliP [Bryobacteraceae bacterium]|nr:flagellar type III secretion system pore protein FliP [Bryobacteraceae bacterium]